MGVWCSTFSNSFSSDVWTGALENSNLIVTHTKAVSRFDVNNYNLCHHLACNICSYQGGAIIWLSAIQCICIMLIA